MTRATLPASLEDILASAGRALSRDEASAALVRDDLDRIARILAEIRDAERETARAMVQLAAAVMPLAIIRKTK